MAKLVIGTDKTVGVPAVVKEIEKQEKYPLLSRVKDDTNKDIGCVVGYHTDANNQKYAVVCLNKEFRSAKQNAWGPGGTLVTLLPTYNNITVYESKETATFNCDTILAQITSAPVSECRSHSFVIGGTTYYGQMPTIVELIYIMLNRTYLSANDPSVSGTEIVTGQNYWASTQYNVNSAWRIDNSGQAYNNNKVNPHRVIPILEIPIV